MENAVTTQTQDIFGSWLFVNNSTVLNIPSPSNLLDLAREKIRQGCVLTSIYVQGFSDGSGLSSYNKLLSERRARKVESYLTHALGGDVEGNNTKFWRQPFWPKGGHIAI